MKAIVAEKYGAPDTLKFEEIKKTVPEDNEMLVKVHAAAANAGDWHLLAYAGSTQGQTLLLAI